ncbi:MAG: YicC/YloC family endoribonuclease [Terriglobia bacterium]
MVCSMTGFAQAQAEQPPWAVSVTVKALNHRFLDLHLRLPAVLDPQESRLRDLIRRHVARGHLDVLFQVECRDHRPLEVDKDLLRSYLELFQELKREHHFAAEPDLTALIRLPGVLRPAASGPDAQAAKQLARLAEQGLADALARLNEMRRAEGAALERELRQRLEAVAAGQKELVGLGARALPACHRRLTQRLHELLGRTPLDPARLAEEAAYLAEHSDVSEELTRLGSHTEQFARLLESDTRVGKRLDFLLQEMNRETNTILSKSSGLEAEGLEMTRQALEIKAQIERLREQVQNVE